MNQKLKEKIRESLSSVLPITVIVLALGCALLPIPIGTLLLFLAGALLLILGMGLFSLGADMAMMPMGEALGSRLTRTRKLPLVVAGITTLLSAGLLGIRRWRERQLPQPARGTERTKGRH